MNLIARAATWIANRAGGLESSSDEITAATLDSLFAEYDRAGPGPHGAMKIVPAYVCVRIIAETIGMLPCRLIESSTDDEGRPRRDHRASHPMQILINAPSEQWTGPVWLETLAGHLAGWGNCYAYIRRGADGRPIELIPLLPGLTWQHRPVGRAESVYVTTIYDRPFTLFPEDVLHVPLWGYDGREGVSPLGQHRRTLGIADAQAEYLSKFLEHAAAIRGVLEHPKKLGEDAINLLRRQFAELYGGTTNAGRTAVLTDGMKFQSVQAIAPADAAYVESSKLTARQIFSIFRVPPSLAGDTEKESYAKGEQGAIAFTTTTLTPYLVKLEAEFNAKLVRERDQGRLGFKFNTGALVRGDLRARFGAYRLGITSGFMTRNEARALEDLNPIEGLDDPLIPLNMGGVDEDGEIVTFGDNEATGASTSDGTGEQGGGGDAASDARALGVLVRNRGTRRAARMAPTHRYDGERLEVIR